MLLSIPKTAKQIGRLQRKGYPIHNVLDIIQNDNSTHTIVYTSPEFQPCSETFSEHYAFVGPSIRPAADRIDKIRDKLIYISMGTVNNAMLPLNRRILSALAETDYQLIMSVGEQVSIESFGSLPEWITVAPFVDQMAVLQQADVLSRSVILSVIHI